jgi:hypothetical protein
MKAAGLFCSGLPSRSSSLLRSASLKSWNRTEHSLLWWWPVSSVPDFRVPGKMTTETFFRSFSEGQCQQSETSLKDGGNGSQTGFLNHGFLRTYAWHISSMKYLPVQRSSMVAPVQTGNGSAKHWCQECWVSGMYHWVRSGFRYQVQTTRCATKYVKGRTSRNNNEFAVGSAVFTVQTTT